MSYDPYLAEVAKQQAQAGDGKVVVEPTEAQRRWLQLKFGLFIHYGINTYNDAEWSDGTLDPATFNPGNFDPDQWCEAAKAAGIHYLLVVTKHHDGFCLWPSRWTDYSVKATPFGGDCLERIADACQRHGLQLGWYYSLWDRNYPGYEHDHGYAIYMKNQLAELLTRYGPIVQFWFDGGWKKGGVDWQDDRRWYWREIYEHIKAIQPDCLVGNNGTSKRKGEIIMWPCDYRCFEKGLPPEDDRKVYYCGGIGDYLPGECEYTLSAGGDGKGMFAGGKWFWHESDHTVQEPRWVVDHLEQANARGANFVINAGPTAEGRLREEDERCLREVGQLRGTA